MQAARNTIMKATEVCPKNEDVWLEAIRLQVIITNLKKKSTVICLPCQSVLDFQEKIFISFLVARTSILIAKNYI